MPTRYIATVHIMVDAKSEIEASNAVFQLLNDRGSCDPRTGVVDWAYEHRPHDGHGRRPLAYAVPDGWNGDKDDLVTFLAENMPFRTACDWQREVAHGATRLGYDEWVRTPEVK